MRLGIVADDFTGACDAAGPFGRFGDVVVALDGAVPDTARAAEADAEVVAIDLDVREQGDARLVAERAEGVVRALVARQWRVLLKIDSTLRGPIGALVEGARRGSGAPVAVIAPAFPAQGRSVRAGRLVLADGSRGPRVADVVDAGSVAEVIGEQAARTATAVGNAVEQLVARGARRVIVDASETETLRAVALAWLRRPEWLLVGSAGLAREVAASAAWPRRPASETPRRDAAARTGRMGDVLVVAGSPAAATRSQLDALAAARTLRPDELGTTLVLATDATVARDSGEASRCLAAEVAERARHGPQPAGLVIAGGATARAVCAALGVERVLIRGEIAPGIPYGCLDGGVWHGVPLVTKAGAFGGETALLDAVRALGVSCDV